MSKKVEKLLIKIFVSGLLFWFILSRIDAKSLFENFQLMDFRLAPVIVLLIVGNYFFSSVRWKKLLIHESCKDVSVKYLTSLYFIGSFFNNFMPTSIGGDVYKIYKLAKKTKSATAAFSSTFMERFTGMIALVLISYVGMIQTIGFWVSLIPQNYQIPSVIWGMKFLLFFGFWIGALVAFFALKVLSQKFSKLNKLYESLIAYKGERGVLVWALVTSFIVQALAISTQYFVFLSLGVNLPIAYSLFVIPVITLASFFIPSLNGLGVQDALYIQFFGVVGVGRELALSASIVYHLFRLFVSLIGGVLYAFERSEES